MPERRWSPDLPAKLRDATSRLLAASAEHCDRLRNADTRKRLYYPWAEDQDKVNPLSGEPEELMQKRMSRLDSITLKVFNDRGRAASIDLASPETVGRRPDHRVTVNSILEGGKMGVHRLRPIPVYRDSPVVAVDTWPHSARFDKDGLMGPHHTVPPREGRGECFKENANESNFLTKQIPPLRLPVRDAPIERKALRKVEFEWIKGRKLPEL